MLLAVEQPVPSPQVASEISEVAEVTVFGMVPRGEGWRLRESTKRAVRIAHDLLGFQSVNPHPSPPLFESLLRTCGACYMREGCKNAYRILGRTVKARD